MPSFARLASVAGEIFAGAVNTLSCLTNCGASQP
jgi:hypothetical protein